MEAAFGPGNSKLADRQDSGGVLGGLGCPLILEFPSSQGLISRLPFRSYFQTLLILDLRSTIAVARQSAVPALPGERVSCGTKGTKNTKSEDGETLGGGDESGRDTEVFEQGAGYPGEASQMGAGWRR